MILRQSEPVGRLLSDLASPGEQFAVVQSCFSKTKQLAILFNTGDRVQRDRLRASQVCVRFSLGLRGCYSSSPRPGRD